MKTPLKILAEFGSLAKEIDCCLKKNQSNPSKTNEELFYNVKTLNDILVKAEQFDYSGYLLAARGFEWLLNFALEYKQVNKVHLDPQLNLLIEIITEALLINIKAAQLQLYEIKSYPSKINVIFDIKEPKLSLESQFGQYSEFYFCKKGASESVTDKLHLIDEIFKKAKVKARTLSPLINEGVSKIDNTEFREARQIFNHNI